jgi:uncharacterized protein (TIGR03437 family)
VKTLFAIVLTLGLLAATGFAQPSIVQIQNAASNAVSPLASACKCNPLPNAAIAQGSYFSIYGSGLGPTTGTLWSPYPILTTLAGTSVSVTMNGVTVAAYPEYVSAGQINAILPSSTPTGTGTLTVSYGGATSATFPITVASMSFGTFSLNEAGSGPGIFTEAYNASLKTFPNTEITPFSTTAPGDYVTIWGTGLGAVDTTSESTGPPTQTNLCASGQTCPVTVWVGNGLKANVTYAGRSPYTGEDQIDFIVPAGVQGCYVQVAVETNSIVSNFTSLAVDPTGPTCSDADGINYASLSSVISSKGQANVAAISMLSNFLGLSILGSPLQWDNDTVSGELATFNSGELSTFQGFTLAPSVGNCSVSAFLQYPPPKDPVLSQVSYLDAGSALSIQGPSGTQPVPKNTNSKGYSGLVGGATIADLLAGGGMNPFFLSSTGWPPTASTPYTYAILPGTFTVSAPGGADVGQFSVPITVSSAAASFAWTNQSSVVGGGTVSRSTPLTITWSGGDPNGFVDITLISSTLSSGETPLSDVPGILAECIAPASAQTFTVPTYVLQSLPSTNGSQAIEPPGELLVGPASVAVSPTALPSGLDALYLFYHYIEGANVTWQ